MKEMITRINRTLFELETGILFFGAVCEIFVLLVEDKKAYSLGLFMGILIAAISAFHMWWTLDRALELDEKGATRKMTAHNVLRYLFITAAFAVICAGNAANPLAAFLGIMGLKISAYLQPFTKKLSTLIYGEEILPELIEEPDEKQDM